MTTLTTDGEMTVLINTFTVNPDRAEELLDALSRATEEVMAAQPGFVSANLHMSLDRRRVTNYAQWASRESYEAVFENATVRGHMEEAAGIAESFDPILYELRAVHDVPASSGREGRR